MKKFLIIFAIVFLTLFFSFDLAFASTPYPFSLTSGGIISIEAERFDTGLCPLKVYRGIYPDTSYVETERTEGCYFLFPFFVGQWTGSTPTNYWIWISSNNNPDVYFAPLTCVSNCQNPSTAVWIPIVPISCGDDVCNGEETCTSCPQDCGSCPIPPLTILNVSSIGSILEPTKDLFTDLWGVIALVIGLPFGFYIIKKIIVLTKP